MLSVEFLSAQVAWVQRGWDTRLLALALVGRGAQGRAC